MRATVIAVALMLATSPAFAGHGGHGGGHGGQGHSSAASSHGNKADRQAARAEHKAERDAAKAARHEAKAAKKQSISVATGTWQTQYVTTPPTGLGAPERAFGSITMQENGRFAGPLGDAGSAKGKVNTRTGAIKGKSSWGKLTGTYTPDDPMFDRSEMSGDILGRHGVDIGDWVADGPDVGNWE